MKEIVMFIVTVDFEIKDGHVDEFMEAMLENARKSVAAEEGCLQFDVCRDREDPRRIFLYEVYTDAAAFDVHVMSSHFREFDDRVNDWTVSKKAQQWERL